MAVVGCWEFLQRDFAREGLCRYGREPTPSLGSLPEPTDLLHGYYMERRRSENTKAPEPVSFRGLRLVAGVGFEPTTL